MNEPENGTVTGTVARKRASPKKRRSWMADYHEIKRLLDEQNTRLSVAVDLIKSLRVQLLEQQNGAAYVTVMDAAVRTLKPE